MPTSSALPPDWFSRTFLRSWLAFEGGRWWRYEVRRDEVSGVTVRARFPSPRAPT